jgi:uncharacterized protein (TIGR02246 family)
MYRPYTSPTGNIPSLPDVESTIRGLTQDFCTAFNTGNYDQVAALFSPDGAFMAPHQEVVSGPKAIERQLRQFGDLGFQDLRIDTLRVDYSGDMAMEIGRYTVTVRRENGVKDVDRGKYVKVWRRLGAWRMIADCWSTNLPAPAEQEGKPLPDRIALIGDDIPKSA